MVLLHLGTKTPSFAPRGTIANGDQLDMMFQTQHRDCRRGFVGLAGMRIDGIGRHQFVSSGDDRDLDTVRRPGSNPIVARNPACAAINKSCMLRVKTWMLSLRFFSLMLPINLVSRCIRMLMHLVQLMPDLR